MAGEYISNKSIKAIRDVGISRTKDEVIIESNNIYQILNRDIQLAHNRERLNLITYIPERKMGKTYSLMKLASEYDIPLIVHSTVWGEFIKKEAKKLFGKMIVVRSINSNMAKLDGIYFNTVLKEEMVDLYKLRNKLNDVGLGNINIVGIN